MKNKFLLVALIGVLFAAGMVLVSCGGCPGDGNCSFNNPDSYCMSSLTWEDFLDNSDNYQKAWDCGVDLEEEDCSC